MKKLLIVGHVARDIVTTDYGRSEYWGGAGYHVAASAAMFLPPGAVILKSVAGRDFDLTKLEKAGIDTSRIIVDPTTDSDRHHMGEVGLTRTYESQGNLKSQITITFEDLSDPDIAWIHLASSAPEQQLQWLKEIGEIIGDKIPVSVDTFDTFAREEPSRVIEVMDRSTLGFVNNAEWEALNGDLRGRNLVRKMGKDGAEYYENGELKFNVKVDGVKEAKDTTGAGEVVAGVFLAQRLLGKDSKDALTVACKMATESVREFGMDHLKRPDRV